MGGTGLEPAHVSTCYNKTLNKSEKNLVRDLVRPQAKPTEPAQGPCPQLMELIRVWDRIHPATKKAIVAICAMDSAHQVNHVEK